MTRRRQYEILLFSAGLAVHFEGKPVEHSRPGQPLQFTVEFFRPSRLFGEFLIEAQSPGRAFFDFLCQFLRNGSSVQDSILGLAQPPAGYLQFVLRTVPPRLPFISILLYLRHWLTLSGRLVSGPHTERPLADPRCPTGERQVDPDG